MVQMRKKHNEGSEIMLTPFQQSCSQGNPSTSGALCTDPDGCHLYFSELLTSACTLVLALLEPCAHFNLFSFQSTDTPP